MRLLTGIAIALALASGTAQAASGRRTDRTYSTMREAARATGAYLFNRYLQPSKAYRTGDMKVSRGYKIAGSVRLLTVNGPKTPMGYPVGRVTVKVQKVKGGYKGYTDGSSRPILLK